MLVGHISDFHTVAAGKKLGDRLDANALARQAVKAVSCAKMRPKFVVFTGDLTHTGTADEVREARSILEELDLPCFILPGAHDDRQLLRKDFSYPYLLTDNGDVRYAVELEGIKLVVLDNCTSKGGHPSFDLERCDWLNRQLSAAPKVPTVLAMYHPPQGLQIATRAYIKDPTATWARGMADVIARHPQVKLVLCGHMHRSVSRLWMGTKLCVAPATCVQVDPMFDNFVTAAHDDRRNFELVIEPPGYLLHWWDNEEFISYTLPTDRTHPRV